MARAARPEQERALRVLTSSAGIVQPRMVAAIERLIDAEVGGGVLVPPIAPGALAYAIVRLARVVHLQRRDQAGIRGDTERLREVEAALLGRG